MSARAAILAPPHVEQPLVEVNLIPTQCHKLAHPESMPVGDLDHGSIPVPVPPHLLSGLDEFINLPW
jgi:hypothetical protein